MAEIEFIQNLIAKYEKELQQNTINLHRARLKPLSKNYTCAMQDVTCNTYFYGGRRLEMVVNDLRLRLDQLKKEKV